MSKSQPEKFATLFNKICETLINALIEDLPTNNNILFASKAFNEIVNKNPIEPISVFIQKVIENDEYCTQLKKGNSDFFLSADCTDLVGFDIVQQIKGIWKELSEYRRRVVMESLQTMIRACDKYIDAMVVATKK